MITDIPCRAAAENRSDGREVRYGSVSLIQEGALVGARNDLYLDSAGGFGDNRQHLRARAASGEETVKRQAAETIYNGLMAMEKAIDLSGYELDSETFNEIFQNLSNTSAELFHVSGWYSVSTDAQGDIIREFYPDYNYSPSQTAQMREKFDAVTEQVMSGINPAWSDREKALYVHDYLASQYQYDETYTKHDAYSLLVEGTAVCQGYTLAYAYFMGRMGIPCTAVSSKEMNHIWNQVQIDGAWYHVDVTYDDPTSPDTMGAAKHRNFLLSDAGIRKTGHKGWTGGEVCSETTYDAADYFWKASDAPFLNDGTDWYFVINRLDAEGTATAQKAGVYRWKPSDDAAAGEQEMLVDLSQEKWYINGSQFYNDKYTGLGVQGGVVYFNTAKQIKYFSTLRPDDVKTLEIPAFTGSIFGLRIKNQALEYTVGRAYDQLSAPKTAKELGEPDICYEWPKPAKPSEEPEASGPAAEEIPSAAPSLEIRPTGKPESSVTPGGDVPGGETAHPTENPVESSTESPAGGPTGTPAEYPGGTPVGELSGVPSQQPAVQPSAPGVGNEAYSPSGISAPVEAVAPSVKPETPAFRISITAKCGAKKFTVNTASKAKVVISMNKKIMRNGKKTCKKLTVAANRNKNGKIVVKLSSKLKKKMKITVVVYRQGGTKKKTVVLKGE